MAPGESPGDASAGALRGADFVPNACVHFEPKFGAAESTRRNDAGQSRTAARSGRDHVDGYRPVNVCREEGGEGRGSGTGSECVGQ